MDIVMNDLTEEYPDGVRAFDNCVEFMKEYRYNEKGIRLDDMLGCWIVWNLYGRQELDDEERQITRGLGIIAIESFKTWWK
jgi:hypothetical protein